MLDSSILDSSRNRNKAAEKAEKTSVLWQKTRSANLVRNTSSGKYFARFKHKGKLIRRALDTDVLSVAAQRLPDKIKEVKDEQTLLASGTDPRVTFEAAAKIYLDRVRASPDFKPRTKSYHEAAEEPKIFCPILETAVTSWMTNGRRRGSSTIPTSKRRTGTGQCACRQAVSPDSPSRPDPQPKVEMTIKTPLKLLLAAALPHLRQFEMLHP